MDSSQNISVSKPSNAAALSKGHPVALESRVFEVKVNTAVTWWPLVTPGDPWWPLDQLLGAHGRGGGFPVLERSGLIGKALDSGVEGWEFEIQPS